VVAQCPKTFSLLVIAFGIRLVGFEGLGLLLCFVRRTTGFPASQGKATGREHASLVPADLA
jgi:hypothetical protein